MVDTWGKVWWRDGWACGCIVQSVEDVIEPRLRAAGILGPSEQVAIFQYCYNAGGVQASAGTHDAGGALDHGKATDEETRIWRESGVADWQRGSPEDPYFDDHNHGIWQGCPHLSDGAADQVVDYQDRGNGLADGGPDPSPQVEPITWQAAYHQYVDQQAGVAGMTEVRSSRRSADWAIPPETDGTWDRALPVDDTGGATVVADTGDRVVVATACLTVAGMAPDEVLDVAWAIADCAPDGGDTRYPTSWADRRDPRRVVAGDKGYRTLETTFVGTLGSPDPGRSRRLRLVYQTSSQTAVLGSLTVEAGY